METFMIFAVVSTGLIAMGWLLQKAATDNTAHTEKRLKRNVRSRTEGAPQVSNTKLKKTGKGFASFLGKNKSAVKTGEPISTRLDSLISASVNDPARFQMLMRQADLKMTQGEFFILCFGVIIGFIGLLWIGAGLSPAIAVVVGLVVGVLGIKIWFAGRIEGRKEKFLKLFPDTLDLMIRGLRTGLPVSETFKIVAKDVPAPVGEEFSNIRDDIKFGYSLEEALWNTSKRLNSQEFKFFTVTLSIQAETGGNLAETLENLANLLRKRQQMFRLIKAKAAEGKYSAMVLGSLPFIMFAVIYFVNRTYAEVLIYDWRGQIIAGAAVIWILIGAMWMRSLAKIDV